MRLSSICLSMATIAFFFAQVLIELFLECFEQQQCHEADGEVELDVVFALQINGSCTEFGLGYSKKILDLITEAVCLEDVHNGILQSCCHVINTIHNFLFFNKLLINNSTKKNDFLKTQELCLILHFNSLIHPHLMLKKSTIRFVLSLIIIALPGICHGANVKIGDLTYSLDLASKSATVVQSADYKTYTSVAIPAKVNYENIDYTVTTLGEQAFAYCTALKSATIAEGVGRLEKFVFYGCTGLTAITIPPTVTYINNSCFSQCSGLKEVNLPDGLQEMGENVFRECTSLESIKLPDDMYTVPLAAFYGCSSLSNVTFPDNLETIGGSAFFNCGFKTLNFPARVFNFGPGAFSNCTKLESVTLPANMSILGDQAFYKCTSLTSVTLPVKLRSIGWATFYECTALRNITLPSTLLSIGKSAFQNCISLLKIDLPEGITRIEQGTFANCESLTAQPVTNNIIEIGNGAYQGCTRLMTAAIPQGVKTLADNLFDGCTVLTSVTVPDGIEYIGSRAFGDCMSLMAFTIPAAVTEIKGNPFIGCQSIPTINVAEGNKNYTSHEGVLYDKQVTTLIAYPGGKASYEMPATVKHIADYAFNSLPGVKAVKFSPNLETIGSSAFYRTGIREFVLGKSLKSISPMAFIMTPAMEKIVFSNTDFTTGNNCLSINSLKTILFPDSVTTIGVVNGEAATIMSSVATLQSIWLPSTLKEWAPFGSGCQQLKKIYSFAPVAPKAVNSNSTIVSYPDGCQVYIPKGSKASYEAAWKDLVWNVTYVEALPTQPVLKSENGAEFITWETFTDTDYPGEITRYELSLYLNSDALQRTLLWSKSLNAHGIETTDAPVGKLPENISFNLGNLAEGDYSVVLKGYTSLGELVKNFDAALNVTAALDDITVDNNTPAEYFNLQGVKVINPVKGQIYIIRKGSKVRKGVAL